MIKISFSERPPTKKRRLDITLQNCILINLKPNLDQPEEVVIPWLQILAALINNLDPEVLEGNILNTYLKYESNLWLPLIKLPIVMLEKYVTNFRPINLKLHTRSDTIVRLRILN